MKGFDESSVLSLGTRWLDRLLPPRPGFRVFLIGGAYKSLIHGRLPRDLDLFAADPDSRRQLVVALRARGARTVRDNPPYQELLSIDEILIEVAYDTEESLLAGRLSRCDLAPSAVGCERGPDGDRALVHSLAHESIASRQVLLLKPLLNWKYALYTLERMYRYAQELSFVVPPQEESYIWSLYASQPVAERIKMIQRYERVSENVGPIHARARALCGASPAVGRP